VKPPAGKGMDLPTAEAMPWLGNVSGIPVDEALDVDEAGRVGLRAQGSVVAGCRRPAIVGCFPVVIYLDMYSSITCRICSASAGA